MNPLRTDPKILPDINPDWADQAKKFQVRFMQLAPIDLPFIGARIRKNKIEVFYVTVNIIGAAPAN